jgi:hypothetical protein
MNQIGNIYSVQGSETLNSGASRDQVFKLVNSNRNLNLKSIFFDINLLDVSLSQPIPATQNSVISYALLIGFGQSLTSKNFEGFSLPASVLYNGSGFTLFGPRKVNFNNWFFQNDVNFKLGLLNFGASVVKIDYTVIVEIEILE